MSGSNPKVLATPPAIQVATSYDLNPGPQLTPIRPFLSSTSSSSLTGRNSRDISTNHRLSSTELVTNQRRLNLIRGLSSNRLPVSSTRLSVSTIKKPNNQWGRSHSPESSLPLVESRAGRSEYDEDDEVFKELEVFNRRFATYPFEEEEDGEEEVTEMSRAINRWRHSAQPMLSYDEARTIVSLTTKGVSSRSTSRRTTPSRPASRRIAPAAFSLPKPARVAKRRSPSKNRSKTTHAGGFGAGKTSASSSPVKSPSSRPPAVASQKSSAQVRRRPNSPETRWEKELPAEMRRIYRHFRSLDPTPRLRRGGEFQDLLGKTTTTAEGDGGKRGEENKEEKEEENKAAEVEASKATHRKSVAFDLDLEAAAISDAILDRRASSGLEPPFRAKSSSLSAPSFSTGFSSGVGDRGTVALEKSYRRNVARYYAGGARRFADVDPASFPAIPAIPSEATSPFLSIATNEFVWRWLNRDFCKTELEFFLALCS